MFPTLVRQPASRKQRESKWSCQKPASFGWKMQWWRAGLVQPVPEMAALAAWPGKWAPTVSPLPHSSLDKEPPRSQTWHGNLLYKANVCFFQFLLSSDQPLVPRLVLLLVQSRGLTFPRHRHCPSSSRAGQWCYQQWGRDMGHVLHQLGPITDLPCCFHLGGWDGAKDSGDIILRPGHCSLHPASFAWEHPALANKSRCSSSKATLMSIYPTCRDINNLINTENT